MSDYTNEQLERLRQYQEEFEQCIHNLLLACDNARNLSRDRYKKLSVKEQESTKDLFEQREKYYEKRSDHLRSIYRQFRRIMNEIKSLASYTEDAIRIRTAVDVVKEQFHYEDNTPSTIKNAYKKDLRNKDSMDLDEIIDDIYELLDMLHRDELLNARVGKNTIYGMVQSLESITLELYRTHSIDRQLKEDLAPKASIVTEGKIQTLDEYDEKVKSGDMALIQMLNSRVFFSRKGFKPSYVIVTGKKARESLEQMRSKEKQIEAIQKALHIISDSHSSGQYKNTYRMLSLLRFRLEDSLKRELNDFHSVEYDVIDTALGVDEKERLIIEYAKIYAELELTLKTSPNSVDKITSLRSKLLQFVEDNHMSKEDVYKAIRKGRLFQKGALPEQKKEEIDFNEERAFQILKKKGRIPEDTTLDSLTSSQREELIRKVLLEEELERAYQRFTEKKMRSSDTYKKEKERNR